MTSVLVEHRNQDWRAIIGKALEPRNYRSKEQQAEMIQGAAVIIEEDASA
jgi:hypothetical protein